MTAAEMTNLESENPVNLSFCLTFDNARRSGIFYRLFEEERFGVHPDFPSLAVREIQAREASGRPYRATTPLARQRLINKNARELASSYALWKAAFSV